MRRWLGLVLFGALSIQATMVAAEEWPLQRIFGARNLGMVQTPRQAVVEYCPDDTCTRFILAGGDSLAALHDFAFLYLALVQQYDIEQTRGPAGERYFDGMIRRRRGACAGADETALARCILGAMARRYPVQGYISRLDEGWRRSEPFDLRAELTRAGIP
jgi:hypothetical protein